MKIISWNLNYWENTHIFEPKKDKIKSIFFKNSIEEIDSWIENCKEYIQAQNADVLLLQEINPYTLFGEKYTRNNLNQYKFIHENKIIFYHELYKELYSEGLRENFWGNAIIINNDYIPIINNVLPLNDNYYYGRNGFMCYVVISKNLSTIKIINYYNKKNRNKNCYSMPYDIRSDLKNVVKEKNDNTIILAGDFNSDLEKDPKNSGFFKFIEEIGFENFTAGKEFETTMVPEIGENKQYPNDKAFIKNKDNVENIICKLGKDAKKNLSDHYPILIEINEKSYEINLESHKKYFPEWDKNMKQLQDFYKECFSEKI